MAKQSISKSGTSRIRFIMLDAEIPEGDLSQITLAIQNALKPTTTIVERRIPAQLGASLPNGNSSDADLDDDDTSDDAVDPSVDVAPTRQTREARPRKPTVPKVLEIDLATGTSFEAFANLHNPKNDVERNLVVLAWFKEHRPDEPVTANHVYTCYRTVKWPSGIDDFSWPLRALKKDQLVTSPGRGQYVINHIGIARVEKMASSA